MNLDRDLRDALRPLAGDPVADAARVMAALPLGPPPGPGPRPWLPWTMLGAGLALGALIGIWIGRSSAPAPAESQPAPVKDQATKEQEAKDKEAKEKEAKAKEAKAKEAKAKEAKETKPPDRPDPFMPDYLGVMAFSPIDIEEPIDGKQHLDPGQWMPRIGTLFMTGTGQAGAYAWANDAAMRLDRQTVARLMPEEVTMDAGRVWVTSGSRNATIRVDAGVASAQIEAGTGMLTRDASGLEVLAIRGTVIVRTARGETVRLTAHERVVIDPDRGAAAKEKVPFLGTATSWMTTMIEQGRDQSELWERVADMVAAYESVEFRVAARQEILKLGANCVRLLVDSVQRTISADRDYALATAQLIARLVDYGTARHALPLLLLEEPAVREVVFARVRDVTGIDVGTDAVFWREASLERRRTAVEQWLKELDR